MPPLGLLAWPLVCGSSAFDHHFSYIGRQSLKVYRLALFSKNGMSQRHGCRATRSVRPAGALQLTEIVNPVPVDCTEIDSPLPYRRDSTALRSTLRQTPALGRKNRQVDRGCSTSESRRS